MLCQLSIRKRIPKLHGMIYKITIPVNSCQQRNFSRLHSFRKSIHKLICTISVPIICHLKIKLMVVIHLVGCIQTCLITRYRVIEIGVMPHFMAFTQHSYPLNWTGCFPAVNFHLSFNCQPTMANSTEPERLSNGILGVVY